jgi:hypothetical protein
MEFLILYFGVGAICSILHLIFTEFQEIERSLFILFLYPILIMMSYFEQCRSESYKIRK